MPIRSKTQWRELENNHPELFKQFQQESPVNYDELPETVPIKKRDYRKTPPSQVLEQPNDDKPEFNHALPEAKTNHDAPIPRSEQTQGNQKPKFITIKRCIITGIAASIVCYIGAGIDSSRSWFITVPICGLPWLLFKISDNEQTGERMETAEAIGIIIIGGMLSLFSAIPVLFAFLALRSLFSGHN